MEKVYCFVKLSRGLAPKKIANWRWFSRKISIYNKFMDVVDSLAGLEKGITELLLTEF